ncbi:MAG: phosphoglycerate dehydrogenase [Acidobacteriota bacterium]
MSTGARVDRPRVLVCGQLEGRGVEILEERGCRVDQQAHRRAGPLTDVLDGYDGVIVHSAHHVDAASLAAAPRLRVVGRAGVGVDNIDLAAATDAGVLVMNLPSGNTVTAAEHTLALMLALARNIPQAAAALHGGEWNRAPYLGLELKEKVLGIVGLGRIGREVARRALAFEMQVLAADPYMSEQAAADFGVELLSLPELLPLVDILTLHLPISDETRHLIDAASLAAMKPGARLVNCARGGLVDERALLASLESGHLAGVACDVFEQEPTANHDLLAQPRFIGTPHLGGATREAQEKIGEGIARQVADFLADGTIRHAINVHALPPEEQRPLIPYLDLGRRLGSLLSQCFTGIEALRIEYGGELTAYTLKPVSAQLLVGFFESQGGDRVNAVNVWSLARQRGVDVEEITSTSPSGYSSLIRIVARVGDRTHSVAGTVFDARRPRLVEVEGLPMEAEPQGNLLLFANDDRPGVVGAVGQFLGRRGINIGDVCLGRADTGGKAIAVLTLDSPLEESGCQEFEALEAIHWARMVKL